jgi:hypothetical protein
VPYLRVIPCRCHAETLHSSPHSLMLQPCKSEAELSP